MGRRVTLQKRCGNPNCTDPRCDYVIVEKTKTVSNYYKKFKKATDLNGFTIFGAVFGTGTLFLMIVLVILSILQKAAQGGM